MANDDLINARGGLLPVTSPYCNVKLGLYKLGTGAAACNIFIGAPMDLDSNGLAVPATQGSTNPVLGPALGFLDASKAGIPSGLTSLSQGSYLPGATDAFVLIADDPDQEFMIQEDTGGSALTQSAVGNGAVWIWRSTSGNTTTGYATAELDRSTIATTTDMTLVVLGLVPYMNSDGTENNWGDYAKLRVKIQNHRLAPKTNVQNV